MGIKYFFSWFKKSFSDSIKTVSSNKSIDLSIDHFLIDLNGIFHYCAQKTYRYGSFSKLKKSNEKVFSDKQKLSYLFSQVGLYLTNLISFVKPNKRLVLCIDGVAPVSKQFQQRQRRFRSQTNELFDSNCITPGTLFMDRLSSYLEWFINMKLATDPNWQNLEIIFSDEKVPGEGEHKLVSFVRNYCCKEEYKNDHFMIHGMDADLIMLALASQKENFHILRDNPYKQNSEFFYINMKMVRESLVFSLLHKPSDLSEQFFINDFILMMFLSGNDFLPHLPTIDILEGSIETFFDSYRSIIETYGPIVSQCYTINILPLSILFGTLASFEIKALEERSQTLSDPLLFKNIKFIDSEPKLDWINYRKEYYLHKLNCSTENEIDQVCKSYLEGMQWILTYYLEGVSCWKWFYPYHYAPFCSDLVYYCNKIKEIRVTDKVISNDKPFEPFLQLLAVLPPKSFSLLPEPVGSIMKILPQFYPEEFIVDMDGKRNDWEGIAILPSLDFIKIKREYKKVIDKIDKKDKYRNRNGQTLLFSKGNTLYEYKSYYGNIKNCNSVVQIIKL